MKFKTEPISFEPESSMNFGKRSRGKAFCVSCQRQVNLITFDTAIIVLCVNPDDFLRLLEEGNIHRLHNSKGKILACLNSVKKVAARRKGKAAQSDDA
jgi:hypothetical protein